MQHVKSKSAAAASALAAMLATGCAATTTETVFVQPECTPAPMPVIDIDRGELWDALGDPEWFWRVDGAFDDLIDWGLENQAIIDRVCGGNPTDMHK